MTEPWKSTITDEMLRGIVRDCDPKMNKAAWEPIAHDSLYQLAYELLQHRNNEDAARYRWLRDECTPERRIEIAEYASAGYLLDHHIDKGRCGL